MPGQETDEGRVEDALNNFKRLAGVLDGHLEGKDYLVDDTLTLADFAVAGNFAFAEPSGLPMEEYPNIRAWLATLDEIPAWKASAPPPMGG
jgi:glutathione S-transferase